MSKIPMQNPGSSEIQSPLLTGITEGLNKISGVLDLQTAQLVNVTLSPISVDEKEENKNRIYEASEGNKLWLSSPTPVFKKNGTVITQEKENFSVDYLGGSITFTQKNKPSDMDVITVDCTHITGDSKTLSDMLASIQENKSKTEKYKGFFESDTVLKETIPSAENGDFAITFSPLAVFAWNNTEWKDTRSVEDLKDYYNKSDVNDLLKKKEDKITPHGDSLIDDDFYLGGRKTWQSTGEKVLNTKLSGLSLSSDAEISSSDSVLAAMGKLQKQTNKHLDKAYISNTGEPTTSTKGSVGQRYVNSSNGDEYICTAISGDTYTWEKKMTEKQVKTYAYGKSETYNQSQIDKKDALLMKISDYKGSADGVVKESDDSKKLGGKLPVELLFPDFNSKTLVKQGSGNGTFNVEYTFTEDCFFFAEFENTENKATILYAGISVNDVYLYSVFNNSPDWHFTVKSPVLRARKGMVAVFRVSNLSSPALNINTRIYKLNMI